MGHTCSKDDLGSSANGNAVDSIIVTSQELASEQTVEPPPPFSEEEQLYNVALYIQVRGGITRKQMRVRGSRTVEWIKNQISTRYRSYELTEYMDLHVALQDWFPSIRFDRTRRLSNPLQTIQELHFLYRNCKDWLRLWITIKDSKGRIPLRVVLLETVYIDSD